MKTGNVINYNQLAPEKLNEIFEKHNVYFPRKLRMDVLEKVIEIKYLEERKELEKLKSESSIAMDIKDSNRLNRLEKYKSLSEFQLENDFIYYQSKELIDSYLTLLWETLGNHIQTLDNSDAIFEDIEKLELEDVKIKTVCDYNRYYLNRVVDEENYFDGIPLTDAVRHFNDTSFAAEITKLSKKYRLSIPKYWTKADLKLRFKKVLKERNELTQEIIDKIESCNVKNLRLLMDENDVDSKLHITKKDMIDLIIKSVDTNKVSAVAQEEEQQLEEPVVEEKVVEQESQKEEKTPVVAPIVIPESKDYESLLKQIIANQEIIINQNSQTKSTLIEKDSFLYSKVFNIAILIMIIIVVGIWIYYGISTLF